MRSLYILALFFGTATLWGLPTPENAAERVQLGLPPDAIEFDLTDLKGDRVVLLLFDLYCPACHKSVSNFNRLTASLEKDPQDVTVLGIALGNTAFETAQFVKKFKLSAPAVPDRERTVGKRFALSKTPSVMLLQRGPNNEWIPLYSHSGYFGRPEVDALLEALAQ